MNAITICQPYAHLIVTPQSELPLGEVVKRCENRVWSTRYLGPLLIHAGVSRDWLKGHWRCRDDVLRFGAIIGLVDVVGCVLVEVVREQDLLTNELGPRQRVISDAAARRWPWLSTHEHSEGPYAWVLANHRRFREPIPLRGQQKIFRVDDDLVADAIATAESIPN